MPYRAWLLLLLLLALAASALAPWDRGDWLLEHVPTAAGITFLVWYERRPGGAPLGDGLCTLLFVFLLLHVVGAHFLYMRVPYDDWCEALFGARPSQLWGSTRNHWDRLVHLCFGLCGLPAMAELVRRHVVRSPGWSVVVAVAFVGVLGKLYELAEWAVAVVMSPEAAEAYNGQQGDPFDAQKDMALALAGSLASGLVVAWRQRRAARRGPGWPKEGARPGRAAHGARGAAG